MIIKIIKPIPGKTWKIADCPDVLRSIAKAYIEQGFAVEVGKEFGEQLPKTERAKEQIEVTHTHFHFGVEETDEVSEVEEVVEQKTRKRWK